MLVRDFLRHVKGRRLTLSVGDKKKKKQNMVGALDCIRESNLKSKHAWMHSNAAFPVDRNSYIKSLS